MQSAVGGRAFAFQIPVISTIPVTLSALQVKSLLPSEADKSAGSATCLVTGLYFRNDIGGDFCRQRRERGREGEGGRKGGRGR